MGKRFRRFLGCYDCLVHHFLDEATSLNGLSAVFIHCSYFLSAVYFYMFIILIMLTFFWKSLSHSIRSSSAVLNISAYFLHNFFEPLKYSRKPFTTHLWPLEYSWVKPMKNLEKNWPYEPNFHGLSRVNRVKSRANQWEFSGLNLRTRNQGLFNVNFKGQESKKKTRIIFQPWIYFSTLIQKANFISMIFKGWFSEIKGDFPGELSRSLQGWFSENKDDFPCEF